MTGLPFTDTTPVKVIFDTDVGALAALMDHPLMLAPDEPGLYFANAARRGVRHLRGANVVEEEGMATSPDPPPLPAWAIRLVWALAGLAAGLGSGAVLFS